MKSNGALIEDSEIDGRRERERAKESETHETCKLQLARSLAAAKPPSVHLGRSQACQQVELLNFGLRKRRNLVGFCFCAR